MKKKGYSLALVLILSSVLLILCAVSGTVMLSEAKQSLVQEKKTQAHYIARAGATATAKWITSMGSVELQKLNSLTFPVYTQPQSFNEGSFEIIINKNPGQLLIESKGSVPNVKKSDGSMSYVTDTVVLALNSIENNTSAFDTVIFGNSSIDLAGGANINGNIGVNVKTTGAISFSGGANINGIVYIPIDGDPNIIVSVPHWANRPDIERFDGNRNYTSPALPEFPEGLPVRGSFTLNGGNRKTINSSGYYDSITIQSDTTLTIDTTLGDIILRINKLDVQQGKIKVKGTGKVKLYLDKLISLKDSLNENGDEEQVELYCNNTGTFTIAGGTTINALLYFGNTSLYISGGASLKGDIVTAGISVIINGGTYADPKIIYAPNADIYIYGGANVDGALIGSSVSVSGGSKVTLTEPSIEIQVPIITDDSSNDGYKIGHWK